MIATVRLQACLHPTAAQASRRAAFPFPPARRVLLLPRGAASTAER
ncbi:MAG: hypothetical protein R3E70_12725 [Burkholderiaceae bacterium]